jgi:uncharacterized membrane protein YphA (DoxX/SURF4 family)
MALSYGQGMALLRIGMGLYFASQVFAKSTGGWMSSPKVMLETFIDPAVTRGTAQGFYLPFLEHVVQPNAALFAQLVVVGEALIAISLILGLLTRVGGLGAAFLTLNYMLMKGLLNNGGSIDRLVFLLGLVFALTAAGLVWGLDGKLRRIFESNAITRWVAGLSGPPPQGVAARS